MSSSNKNHAFLAQQLSCDNIYLIAGLLTLAASLKAQEVVAPLNNTPLTAPVYQADQNEGATSATGTVAPLTGSGGYFSSGLPIGPFTLHPHVDYRLLYGTGIQSAPGRPSSTAINTLAPGLLADLGTHWTVDYTPSWNYYSNSVFRDTLDHAAKADFETTYEELIVGFSQSFTISNQPLVETGTQTREEDYITKVNVDYQFGSQLMLESVANQTVRLTSSFNDTRDWSLYESLHLELSPRLSTAIGVQAGYTSVSNAADMNYYRLDGRVVWHPVDQFNFQVQGGFETRSVHSKAGANITSPTFGATIQYHPLKATTLSLNAEHSTSVSYFSNEVLANSHVTLAFEQRFLGNYNFKAGVGYQESTYRATVEGAAAGRKDESMSFNTGLQTIFFRKFTLGLTYQGSHNKSNAAGFAFSSNQIGLEVSYRY